MVWQMERYNICSISPVTQIATNTYECDAQRYMSEMILEILWSSYVNISIFSVTYIKAAIPTIILSLASPEVIWFDNLRWS